MTAYGRKSHSKRAERVVCLSRSGQFLEQGQLDEARDFRYTDWRCPGCGGGDCRIKSNKAGRASGARPGGDPRDGSKTVPGSPKQPRGHSSPPTNLQQSIAEGDKLYATDCSMCHGSDGHTPSDSGRGMYPRASDLTSPLVQSYADRELFWIVKNGIRLSGMPAFGRVESDEHIWNLVNYLRTMQEAPVRRANRPNRG